MKKIFLVLILVSCQIYAQAGADEEKWANLSCEQKFNILKPWLTETYPDLGAKLFALIQNHQRAASNIRLDAQTLREKAFYYEGQASLLEDFFSRSSHDSIEDLFSYYQNDSAKLDVLKRLAYDICKSEQSVPTLSSGLAQFESTHYDVPVVSRIVGPLSGRTVVGLIRGVLTDYALDKVMTPEQQSAFIFNYLNGYLVLTRAQAVHVGVDTVYAAYVYDKKIAALQVVQGTLTVVGVNAIDTLLDRHAPEWFDYPAIIKNNGSMYFLAQFAAAQAKGYVAARTAAYATNGCSRAASYGVNFVYDENGWRIPGMN